MAAWLDDSVFYQIYPLGFCGCARENAPVDEADALASATPAAAADAPAPISKVADWADYLQSLGIGAVLLNPVFESDTHGYDTRDLTRIDRRLGTNADFADVCRALHDHGIRVVLDAVFNHVGRGFWAFRDVQARRWDSPYKDWFHLSFDGDSAYGDGFWYEGWEGHYELVKLNLQNPAVVDYLLDCVRGWARDFDIDGLRLDVAYSLDHGFLRRLHDVARELKPGQGGLALIGETLHGDYNQLVNDAMLDSCTNYECYKGLYSSFNSVNMFEIAHSLHRQFGGDPWCIYQGKHLLSFADNHDVTRLASILTDPACVRPAYGVLFGMPGVPCLYYGSEWGTTGVKGAGDDWDLRPSFAAPEPNDLTAFIARLVAARTGRRVPLAGAGADGVAGDAVGAPGDVAVPAAAGDPAALPRASRALCHGGYRNVVITNKQLLFERAADGACVYVAVNAVAEPFRLQAGELAGAFVDLLTGERAELDGGLDLAGYDVRYLLRV